mmetsp:Transcript_17489/g.26762  ORF Transcript_17489/g.26762 Transcript_17489/m.26762 type:complete len:87 (+) Transcript_17489:66-326(+)
MLYNNSLTKFKRKGEIIAEILAQSHEFQYTNEESHHRHHHHHFVEALSLVLKTPRILLVSRLPFEAAAASIFLLEALDDSALWNHS